MTSSFSRSKIGSRHRFVLVAIFAAIALLHLTVVAQPSQDQKAEALYIDALLAAGSEGSEAEALAKFDEAAKLFRTVGNIKRVAAVELEHGKYLKRLGIRELNADKLSEALAYFEKAAEKLRPHGYHLELAYVYHNIAFIAAKQDRTAIARTMYVKARVEYALAGDRDGQAKVLRNLGLLSYNEKKFNEAIVFFTSALRLRAILKQSSEQALLQTDIGDSHRESKRIVQAAANYNSAVDLYQNAKDPAGEATAFLRLGGLFEGQFKYPDALKNYASALKIFENTKDYNSEASTAETIGGLHLAFGKYPEAERSLSYAVGLFMILKDKNSEGTTALDLAIAYRSLNRISDARATIQRAIACFREGQSVFGEAYALLIDAEFLSYLNQHDEALAKIKAAQQIFAENKGAGSSQIRIASALSDHYYYLSNYGEAIRYGETALALVEKEKDDLRIARLLLDLANIYSNLSQNDRSISLVKRALALARKTDSPYLECIALSNIGYSYFLLKNYPVAEQFFKRSLAIMRANGYEREEGYAVNNLGLVYFEQHKYPLALASYERALTLYLKTGDRRPEAFVYDSFGQLYAEQGQYEKAAENLQRAIILSREIKYSEVEANALGHMMELWNKQDQKRLAVLYGKEAINVYQSIRGGNRMLDKASQKSFVESHEETYRRLANLLIDEGRLGEAQQVFDLLKEEEFMEFVRRDAAEAVDQAKLALTDPERKALDEYSKISTQLTAFGARFQTLQDAKNKSGGTLPTAEEAEFQSLKTQIEEAAVGIRTFLAKLASEFSKKVEDQAVITPESIESLRADLRRAGPDVVLVSTYLLPERYRAIVTTGRTMVDRKVEYKDRNLTSADINRKISEFQRALQNPKVDPRPLRKELYDIFVKPLEGDLQGAGAKTILWSLDGTLRYIPMAALSPDGKTYLAEKYQNVIVTLARQTNLFTKPSTDEWRALGAGVSKPHEGFAALHSVINELNSIVKENSTTGVLDGKKLIDEKFDLNALRDMLPQQTEDGKSFNVVHLATHFKLGANDQDSALLLGDGKRLSLFEINKDEGLDFKDIELLALSACETGVAAGDGSGREVESLGMLAQKKGAKAVLATLWKVADEGTSMFMSEFYRLKKANPQMSKAEAIRLTQKEMIDGKIKATGQNGGCRSDNFVTPGKQNDFKCDPNAPFSHPYFWSPFILIGNWR